MRLRHLLGGTIAAAALVLAGPASMASAAPEQGNNLGKPSVVLGCSAELSTTTPAAGSVVALRISQTIGSGLNVVEIGDGTRRVTSTANGTAVVYFLAGQAGRTADITVTARQGSIGWSCSTDFRTV
ncbi:hypothetical protein GIS00_18415 [Nakamurella sp. YIM 132087]|uniref:Uncharacterized protein n=1 Tax=Nakamurella alba TaxID=2665158 RepID=A0A7K1FP24_9ACTN|nr:hypothetical protein [Nakamurella alba]MTD15912.1 hypothetical protein [Nakamurella alba]